MGSFEEIFSHGCDPRGKNAQHDFVEILFIALLAQLCGAESCVDMADFARSKREVLGEVLDLRYGTPSHDTFSRVFRRLDPVAFGAGFQRFTEAFGHKLRVGEVVAIDGKAVRGAYEQGRKTTPLHLVNVWATGARLAIAQTTAPGRNEVAGVLDALALLDLGGCVVTADALHCRADVAQAILDAGAHYVLALKSNHPRLLKDAAGRCEGARGSQATSRQEIAHGRIETRHACVVRVRDMAQKHGIPGISAVARVTASRAVAGQPATTSTRLFLLSKPVPAPRLLRIVRQHWHIENRLHWVLDVVFHDDLMRLRTEDGPKKMAPIKHMAMNLIRATPGKDSLKTKRKAAGWDQDYLKTIITQTGK